jgi:peptidoglycan/LPS O-acetylase OafA/YrhL
MTGTIVYSARTASGYRPDIDGLRGIAVLAVILFHADFQGFGGGYSGVDIFFVISGFLITGILRRELTSGGIRFARFYERRARRILPALVLVILACLPAAWLWLTPRAMHGFGSSIVATLTFLANAYFFLHQDYFAPSTAELPLVHTWSLAVEEQFYLFFPWLLIIVSRRTRRELCMLLAGLSLASLALSVVLTHTAPAAAFYLLPTRIWELLLGSLAALVSEGASSGTFGPWRRAAEWASALALLALGVSIAWLNATTPWPGYAALLPTLASAILLTCAPFAPLTRGVLSHDLLTWPGRVSYSAYLWHQPLFAFAHIALAERLSGPLRLALVALSFALAYASWRWVEQPARQSAVVPRTRFGVAMLACVAGLLIIGAAARTGTVWPIREADRAPLAAIETFASAPCFEHQGATPAQIAHGELCQLGAPAATASFALLGDSHAATLFSALARAATRHERAFFALADGWCAPLIGFETPMNARCSAFVDAAVDQLVRHPEVATVFIHAQWALYTSGFRDQMEPMTFGLRDGPQARDRGQNPDVLQAGLAKTVARLLAAGKRVIMVGPTPELPYAVIETRERQQLPGYQLFHPLRLPPLSLSDFVERNRSAVAILTAIQGVEYLDAGPLYCTSTGCPALDGVGVPRFSDSNHLTGPGAAPLVQAMLDRLSRADPPAGGAPPAALPSAPSGSR